MRSLPGYLPCPLTLCFPSPMFPTPLQEFLSCSYYFCSHFPCILERITHWSLIVVGKKNGTKFQQVPRAQASHLSLSSTWDFSIHHSWQLLAWGGLFQIYKSQVLQQGGQLACSISTCLDVYLDIYACNTEATHKLDITYLTWSWLFQQLTHHVLRHPHPYHHHTKNETPQFHTMLHRKDTLINDTKPSRLPWLS